MRLDVKKERIAVLLLIAIPLTFLISFVFISARDLVCVHRTSAETRYAAGSLNTDALARIARPQFRYPGTDQGPSEIFKKEHVEEPFTFIVYGDTREPSGPEKAAIVDKIISEKPDFCVHLGDMVSRGEEKQWAIFDQNGGRIINSGILFFPALGNHEYYSDKKNDPADPEKLLKGYFQRFKIVKNKHWYSFKYGNSLFLILDSNIDYYPGSYQHQWLMDKLKSESPDFLFIGLHHPIHTKAKNKMGRTREKLLAGIFESYSKKGLAKTDIVFAADMHNYERYKHNGINYVVTGGGGAPQHNVTRDLKDFYQGTGKTFHYCRITVYKNKLDFVMIKLDTDTGKWVDADSFSIVH